MNRKKLLQMTLAFALVLTPLLVASSARGATVQILDSPTQAQNASTRQNWLGAIGISSPEYLIDFESGFADEQTIGAVGGLFPAGLILSSTTGGENRVKIKEGSGSIKLSNPVGDFAVLHTNDQPYFVLDFSSNPVDYVGFQDIDHEGLRGQIMLQGGTIIDFDGIDETDNIGDSAEFVGFYNNAGPRIAQINFESSGDSGWGMDNIEYGITSVPEPRSFAALSAGCLIGLICIRRYRVRAKADRACLYFSSYGP